MLSLSHLGLGKLENLTLSSLWIRSHLMLETGQPCWASNASLNLTKAHKTCSSGRWPQWGGVKVFTPKFMQGDNSETLPVYEIITRTKAMSVPGLKAWVFICSGYGYSQDNRKPPPVKIIVLIMLLCLVIKQVCYVMGEKCCFIFRRGKSVAGTRGWGEQTKRQAQVLTIVINPWTLCIAFLLVVVTGGKDSLCFSWTPQLAWEVK